MGEEDSGREERLMEGGAGGSRGRARRLGDEVSVWIMRILFFFDRIFFFFFFLSHDERPIVLL